MLNSAPMLSLPYIVEQLNVIFGQNRSVGDTSMKFGMNVVCKSLFQKKVLAIKNSNMAAIFFKMVASTLKIAKNSKNRSSLSIYFQLLPLKGTANTGVAKRMSSFCL